jgi:hypothetical protein
MKFKLPQRNNLLIPNEEDFCSLETIGLGFYRYSIRFDVNPVASAKAKVSKVRVFATRDPNPKFNTPIFNLLSLPNTNSTPLDGSQIVYKLLRKEALERTAIRSSDRAIMVDETVDYTSRIPNTLTGKITAADANDEIVISSTRKFVNTTVEEARKNNPNITALEQTVTPLAVNNENIKVLSNELVFGKGLDPAMAITKQRNIKFSDRVFGGLVQTTEVNNLIPARFAGISTSLSALVTTNALRKNILPNSIITVPTKVDSTVVSMNEIIDLPMVSIGKEDFYFVLIAEDEFGIPLQKTIKGVEHARNVALLETPVSPPVVHASSNRKLGSNILQIKQTDPNAFGVNIYRKSIKKSLPTYDAAYTFVKKVPLTFSHDFILVNDDVDNTNEIFYRVIPYGVNEQSSAEFTAATTMAVAHPFINRRLNNKINFAPFSFEIFNSSIELTLRNIPDNVVSVCFYKQSVSSKIKPALLDKPFFVSSQEIKINDSNVSIGKLYRYTYKFFYRDGTEVIGNNELVVEFAPENKNVIDTRISQPRAVANGNSLDITFSMQTNINENTQNIILSALAKQGSSQFFSNNVKKETLNELIAYNIIRQNDFTGEIEDLGTIASTDFSDVRQSGAVGAKPIQQGFKYTYSIKTFLRAPTTVLEDYDQGVTEVNTPEKSFSYKPYFWKHPVTLLEGNIVTKESLKRNHAKTEFSFGDIGKINSVTVSLADVLPIITNAVAQKFNKKTVKIMWKIAGAVTKIDHFIIVLEVLGMKTVVGKCHNISDSNYFEFIDILTDGESGFLTYNIIPVFYDYARGTSVKTNGLVI